MKGTVYYCDRCYAEGVSTPAGHKAWIRTTLGGHTLRVDVCEKHLALILGQGGNGGPPAEPPQKLPDGRARPSRKLQKTSDGLLALAAKHPRFSFEDALGYLGKEHPRQRMGRALTLLVEHGQLERHMLGVYQRPGHTMPEPASVELAAAAVLKLVKARPGIRGSAAAALAGIETDKLWRATREHLREHKLVRFKGTKSAMRVYPL